MMTVLIWVAFGVLMALWTGFAALSAGLVEWLLSGLSNGQIAGAAQSVGQWPIPAWLGAIIDPVLISDLQQAWLDAVQWLTQVMPSAGSLTGWIAPLMWTIWGIVSLCLLALAGLGHWLTRRVTG